LNAPAAMNLFTRAVQLMESTTVAVPGLARAGAPAIEDARQALVALRLGPGQQHAGTVFTFLTSLRSFFALADSMAKPFPFPEEGRRQFGELRETLERIESHFRALLDQKETLLRGGDRDQLARYGEANAKVPQPQPGKLRVVFLGDSITDGWRLNEYFPDHDFVNRGIGGQITGQMLGRMKADVLDLHPGVLVVLGGTNDIARGVPVESIRNNLSMIAALAEAHRIRVVLATILPIHDYHKDKDPSLERSRQQPMETIRGLNKWLESFCAQRGHVFLNYFSDVMDPAGFLKAELADDGLHPNSAGYRIMAPLALAAIEKAAPPTPQPKQKKRRFPF